MMIREEQLHETIGALYETIQDPSAWATALEGICSLVRAESGILFAIDHQTDLPMLGLTLNHDPKAWEVYSADYHQFDLWRQAVARLPIDSVYAGPELIPKSTFRSSIWLNEFLTNYDVYHLLATRPDGPGQQFLSFFRSEKSEDFGPAEKRLLRVLVPHVSAALRAYFKLSEIQSRSLALDAALDHVSVGLILIDQRGCVIEMNRVAHKIATSNDGLQVRGRHLVADRRSQSRELDDLIARAVAVADGEDVAVAGSLAIPRPSNRRPYSIHVTPIPARRGSTTRFFDQMRPSAIVFVNDPDREIDLPQHYLRRTYGLTPAEARLATRLAKGESLTEIADEFEIAVGTARNQLKSVFQKTDTRRQAELVKLLLSEALLMASTPTSRHHSG